MKNTRTKLFSHINNIEKCKNENFIDELFIVNQTYSFMDLFLNVVTDLDTIIN